MTKLNVDMEALTKLAALLNESGLTEIEWEEGDVKVRLGKSPAPVMAAASQAPAAAPAMAGQPGTEGGREAETAGTKVLSPMVGTVYTAPEPGARPFVTVGDTIEKGHTVMIVEAMKTMNPVPAPLSGKVVAVLVENEQPVEFEQPLVVIE